MNAHEAAYTVGEFRAWEHNRRRWQRRRLVEIEEARAADVRWAYGKARRDGDWSEALASLLFTTSQVAALISEVLD